MKRTFITQPHARGAPSVAVVSATVALFVALAGSNAALAESQESPYEYIGPGTPISSGEVIPDEYSGNPDCLDIGLEHYEPRITGAGTYGPFIVTLDGKIVGWTSSIGVDAVIVKGGNGANIYKYSEGTGDQGLAAPDNAGLSHIDFCYDKEMRAEKTADARWYKKIDWTITKTASPLEASANVGEGAIFSYEVAVTKTETFGPYLVTGQITVINEGAIPAEFVVSDSVEGVGAAVSCPKTSLLPTESVVCTYSAELAAPTDGTNTATITSLTAGVGGAWASAPYSFGPPIPTEGSEPEAINVTDTNGQSWMTAASGFWMYSVNRACSSVAGDYSNGMYSTTFPNTATIVETKDNANAQVTLNCYAPLVSKNALPSFTRTYDWTIDKSVDIKRHELDPGETGTSTYAITLTKSEEDSGFAVAGTISVQNPNPVGSMTVALSDNIDGIAVSLDCASSLNVPAAGSATCGYSASLPNADTRTNTATATINGAEFSGQASVDFSNVKPTVSGYPEIHVTDVAGDGVNHDWGPISTSQSFTYTAERTCASTIQEYWDAEKRSNIATITETKAFDTEEVEWLCKLPPNATLTMTKSAVPAWDRDWDWTIEKSADQGLPLTLSIGESFLVNYDVTVTPTKEDLFKVSGQVNITNADPNEPALIASLSDLMSPGDIGITLTCPVTFPYTLAGGATLTCSYDRTLTAQEATDAGLPPAGGSTVLNNLATAKTEDDFYGDQTFTAPMSATFTTPNSEADKCVDVTDTNLGEEQPLATQYCADSGQKVFEYPLTIGPYMECGKFTVRNVASLETDDDKTLTAEWTINVDVPCMGCTLTPGYWKTHSTYGPAKYDEAWMNLGDADGDLASEGQDEGFFKSGQNYYQVLWTSPGGNAYYILARAYIAAKLNVLDGAASPQDVKNALAAAEVLFNTYTPTQVAKMKGSDSTRKQFISLAGTLDNYNNGLTGPGHCSEDSTSGS